MPSLFGSTLNTRALLPNSYQYIRSDVPDKLTAAEIEWLLTHRVTTVIDLREETERQKRPCPLEKHTAFTFMHLPVTGGGEVPASPADVPASYIRMADGRMQQILDVILSAPEGVLFFCNAGKDRTGVVSAMLLRRLGVERPYIIADYLLSAQNLQPMLTAYAQQHPQADPAVITPQERYIAAFLDWLDAS